MNYGGYHDWFLPSYNELNYVLYNNMSFSATPPAGKIGGFQSNTYWSSTEEDAGDAWGQWFGNGSYFVTAKWFSGKNVRCVRIY